MNKLPRLTGKQLITTLKKAGFKVIRIKGSHHFLRHTDGRSRVVPVHAGEIVGPGLPSRILRDCDLDQEQLGELL